MIVGPVELETEPAFPTSSPEARPAFPTGNVETRAEFRAAKASSSDDRGSGLSPVAPCRRGPRKRGLERPRLLPEGEDSGQRQGQGDGLRRPVGQSTQKVHGQNGRKNGRGDLL